MRKNSLCFVLALLPAIAYGETGDPYCGSRCLYAALRLLDVAVDSVDSVEEYLGEPPAAGYSIQELADGAKSFGAYTLGVSTSLELLKHREDRFVCIAYLDEKHFVIIHDVLDDGRVTLLDPPRVSTISEPALRSRWDGVALLIGKHQINPVQAAPHFVARYWVLTAFAVLLAATSGMWLVSRISRDA